MADRLDLRDLRYFEAIAEAGHVGRAARALHRSQPTLTGAVRRLEERLGTALFEKAGRGIRLTAAGDALRSRARTLRITAEDAEREVADIGRGEAGLVRIGMVPTAARFLMPALCGEALGDAPKLALRAMIANNDVLRAALKSGELDFTVNLADPADDEVDSHRILRDDCVVVAARGHPIFRARPTMKELARHGFILPGPTVATREWLERAFRDHGLAPPRVQLETDQGWYLPALVERTGLLGFISRRHLTREGPLREVKLAAATMHREFCLCQRRDRYQSPAAQRMIRTLRTRGAALFEAAA